MIAARVVRERACDGCAVPGQWWGHSCHWVDGYDARTDARRKRTRELLREALVEYDAGDGADGADGRTFAAVELDAVDTI